MIENRGSIPTIYFHHSEQDMRYALQQPFVSIGSDGTAVKTEGPLSEGNPHPLLRNISARARPLCPRREGPHDGRGHPQDDLGQCRED